MKKLITILCFGLAVAACSGTETDEQIFALKCSSIDNVELNELQVDFMNFTCSLSDDQNFDILSVQDKLLMLDIIEDSGSSDEAALQERLSNHPALSKKIMCIEDTMIYGTGDKDLLARCMAQ